jgi:hypothetical protein
MAAVNPSVPTTNSGPDGRKSNSPTELYPPLGDT